jgi:hypothetical protein
MNLSTLTSLPKRAVELLSVSDAAQAFADANRPIWSDGVSDANGTLLAEVTLNHPGYIMDAGIAGNFLADELGLNLSFMIRHYDRELGKILNSYAPHRLVTLLSRYRHPWLLARALTVTHRVYRDLKDIDDLLDLTYEGIPIGDLVYNTYIARKNVGTIDTLSRDVLPYLFETIFFCHYYEYVIETRDVRAVLAAQSSYSKGGVLLRLGVKHNLDTFERIFGAKAFTIRRFREQKQVVDRSTQPDAEIFEHIWENYREQAIEETDEYFEKRLSGADEDVIVSKAYGEDKEEVDRTTLANDLDIDPDKPMIVIMSHVFLDAGHFPGGLFQDYVIWLRETLQHVRTCQHTNWIVKSHPGAERFDCEHTVLDEYEQAVDGFDDHTVRILPDDVSTAAVHNFADAVVTVRGSAGIEFPALGTPAIVAGQNDYTGFGFTREPESKQEYFELLTDIDKLSPVTDRERDRARVMAYFRFMLTRVPSKHVPEMPKTAIDRTDDIWRQGAELLSGGPVQDAALRNRVSKFIRDDHRHLLQYDAIGL